MLEVWEGTIQYGKYIGHKWYGFTSHQHPLVQKCINSIQNSPENFEGYDLYLVGGILEGWLTWDLDFALHGPYDPPKIKKGLNWITEVCFDHHIYPDPIYQELSTWNPNTIDYHERWGYNISNKFIKDGEEKDLSNYIKVEEGLYKHIELVPYEKQRIKLKEGYKYQIPIKLL